MRGRDGLQILTELRRLGMTVPVLILTARDDVEDRVIGLDAGADDYLVKPFAVEELEARIRAQLRRSRRSFDPTISFGSLALDTETGAFAVDGRPLQLTRELNELGIGVMDQQARCQICGPPLVLRMLKQGP